LFLEELVVSLPAKTEIELGVREEAEWTGCTDKRVFADLDLLEKMEKARKIVKKSRGQWLRVLLTSGSLNFS
jgi:NifB/MoaA-like Fe-S oxidoreductase